MLTPAQTRPAESIPASQRLMSVDALRGFDMFWIIGADALVACAPPHDPEPVHDLPGRPTRTRGVEGFHFYDLIFPLFVFIVGVSLVFSLTKNIRARGPGRRAEAGVSSERSAVRRRDLLLGRLLERVAGYPLDGSAQSDCARLFLRGTAVLFLPATRARRDLRRHSGRVLGAHDVHPNSRHPIDQEPSRAARRASG